MVHRPALTLKLLTNAPTGAIVAPHHQRAGKLGGPRNWDHRYTSMRDAAFTLYALLRLGFTEEADAFMDWRPLSRPGSRLSGARSQPGRRPGIGT